MEVAQEKKYNADTQNEKVRHHAALPPAVG